MHVWIILFSLMLAVGIRWLLSLPNEAQSTAPLSHNAYAQQWRRVLGAFLIPPVLLLLTAVTMLQMGPTGVMLGVPVGHIGFIVGLGFISSAGIIAAYLGIQGWRSLRQIRTHSNVAIYGYSGRVLNTEMPFAGQVGFWNPELVVSQGLLDVLTPEQMATVLTHEDAHQHYHDTFWFFWLGWLRTLTCWLPQTRALWQELLLLREIRADWWATQVQGIDPILLAESLLQVVRLSAQSPLPNCATFNLLSSTHRLDVRINALLASGDWAEPTPTIMSWQFGIALLPLVAIALHH
ncbi:MAG: M56 family metallopeptidase [Cyanobacteria bacterium P01_A01_bin.37]